MDSFTTGYVAAALWSSVDDNEEPLDANFSPEDIAPDAIARIEKDCEAFQVDNQILLSAWYGCGQDENQAGMDFWLTRNGHGAGFWDRFSAGRGARLGNQLTQAAHGYGACDLCPQDGLLYVV